MFDGERFIELLFHQCFSHLLLFFPSQVSLEPSESIEASFEPLVTFVEKMSFVEKLPDKQSSEDFGHILSILKASSTSPTKTSKAVQEVKESASADRMILATFNALPQGKRFLELADESCQKKLKANEHLLKFDTVRAECAAFSESFDSGRQPPDMKMLVDESWRLAKEYATAASSPSVGLDSTHASTVAAKKDASNALSEFIADLAKSHLATESLEWVGQQCRRAEKEENDTVFSLDSVPAWHILRLRGVEAKYASGAEELICLVITFHDATAELGKCLNAAFAEAASLDRNKATTLCSSFSVWRNSQSSLVQKLRDTSPTFIEALTCLSTHLQRKVGTCFQSAWVTMMEKPISVLLEIARKAAEADSGLLKALAATSLDISSLMEICNDAGFIVTGMGESDAKMNLQTATSYMKFQMDAFNSLKIIKESEEVDMLPSMGKTMRNFFDMFKAVLDLAEESKPTLTMGIKTEACRLLAVCCRNLCLSLVH